MLRLLGIPVSDDDARRLIATLVVEGTPDAMSAAEQIAKRGARPVRGRAVTGRAEGGARLP